MLAQYQQKYDFVFAGIVAFRGSTVYPPYDAGFWYIHLHDINNVYFHVSPGLAFHCGGILGVSLVEIVDLVQSGF